MAEASYNQIGTAISSKLSQEDMKSFKTSINLLCERAQVINYIDLFYTSFS